MHDEVRHQKMLMRQSVARLARPHLAACVWSWRSSWEEALKAARDAAAERDAAAQLELETAQTAMIEELEGGRPTALTQAMHTPRHGVLSSHSHAALIRTVPALPCHPCTPLTVACALCVVAALRDALSMTQRELHTPLVPQLRRSTFSQAAPRCIPDRELPGHNESPRTLTTRCACLALAEAVRPRPATDPRAADRRFAVQPRRSPMTTQEGLRPPPVDQIVGHMAVVLEQRAAAAAAWKDDLAKGGFNVTRSIQSRSFQSASLSRWGRGALAPRWRKKPEQNTKKSTDSRAIEIFARRETEK
jgi:hypothetical protein